MRRPSPVITRVLQMSLLAVGAQGCETRDGVIEEMTSTPGDCDAPGITRTPFDRNNEPLTPADLDALVTVAEAEGTSWAELDESEQCVWACAYVLDEVDRLETDGITLRYCALDLEFEGDVAVAGELSCSGDLVEGWVCL